MARGQALAGSADPAVATEGREIARLAKLMLDAIMGSANDLLALQEYQSTESPPLEVAV
jgi:hypothetical protein